MKARMLIRLIGFILINTQIVIGSMVPAGRNNSAGSGIMVPNVTDNLPEEIQGRLKKKDRKIVSKGHMHKVYTDMSFDELLAVTRKKITGGDIYTALKYYEQLLKISTDVNKTAELMIEYADLLFEQGELNKARLVYNELAHLYPGHTKHEYALYRATLCSFYLTLSTDRDQTMTEDTLQLTKSFLDVETYTAHRQEVTDIQKQCYKKMVESELGICDFYLKQGSFTAVEQRLAHIKTEYLPQVPTVEADVLAMELELSKRKDRTVVVAQASQKDHASKRF